MATVAGESIILSYNSLEDAELLAAALRGGVFGGLTVKDFHREEAIDVLRLLWANIVNEGTFEPREGSYHHGGSSNT